MSIIKTLVIAVIAGTAMLASAMKPAVATVAVQGHGGQNKNPICTAEYICFNFGSFSLCEWVIVCTESPEEEDESEVPPGA